MLQVARLLFLIPLVAAPWLFGGTETYLVHWLVWPVVASLLIVVANWLLGNREAEPNIPLVALPVGLGVLLAAIQFLPLFGAGGLPATSANLRWELLASEDAGLSTATLVPAATQRQMAWLILAATTLALGSTLLRCKLWQIRFLAVISLNGAALALMSIVQLATWNGRIYWTGPQVSGGPPAVGPFVYHNQAGAYFAMCLACWFGWELLRRYYLNNTRESQRVGTKLHRLPSIASGAIGVCLVGGLLASFSRGALLATVTAAAITLLLARRQFSAKVALSGGTAILLAAVGLLVWLNANDKASTRFSSLLFEQTYQEDGRIGIWQTSFNAAAEHWGIGAGLGAFKHLNPLYESRYFSRLYEHAHNQFLEALVDGGVVALALLLWAIVLAAIRFIPAVRRLQEPNAVIAAVALFALAFQVLHGFIDFCLYLPANLLLFATLLAVAWPRTTVEEIDAEHRGGTPLRKATLALMLCGAVWAGWVTHRHAIADGAIQSLPWLGDPSSATLLRGTEWVDELRRAARLNPADGETWQALGEAHILRYRIAARDGIAEEIGVSRDTPSLWDVTQPSVLLNRAATFASAGDTNQLAELRAEEIVQNDLPAATDAFGYAAEKLPLLPRPATRLVELSWLAQDKPSVGPIVERAMMVSPYKPERLLRAGDLAFLAHDYEAAWPAWKEAIRQSPQLAGAILPKASVVLDAEQLAEQLLPDDGRKLDEIVVRALPDSASDELRSAVVAHTVRTLKTKLEAETQELMPEERRVLGRMLGLQQRHEESTDSYSIAIAKRPTEYSWRFEFAQQLLLAGRLDQAAEEAAACVAAKPKIGKYQQLLRQIRRQQNQFDRENRGSGDASSAE